MEIITKPYQYKNMQNLCEFTLSNDNGMEVKLLNYGATLEKVLLPINAKKENVIMSLPTPEDYSKERNFLGGSVGRIVGRIRKGQWRFGNHILQLPLNDGNNHIHGGSGTDTEVWSFEPYYNDHEASVKFTLVDFDGHNGYPGNLKIEVTYTLNNENKLLYQIRAVSDKLTIFNPTNHVYFRLDGPESNIKNLKMQINADYYLPLDNESLPNSEMTPVANTIFDMRKLTKLGTIVDSNNPEIQREHGLNHPYILRGQKVAAKIISDKNHCSMTMTTDAPSVVVYTANHFNHTGIANSLGQFDGVTLEAQIPPAPDTNLNAIILLPNEKFTRNTCWAFKY